MRMNRSVRTDRPSRGHPGSIPPDRWTGERSCLVGPFRDERLAKHYEHWVVHRGGVRTSRHAVKKLPDGWYIVVPSRSR